MYIYNDVLNDAPNAGMPLKETLFLGLIILQQTSQMFFNHVLHKMVLHVSLILSAS